MGLFGSFAGGIASVILGALGDAYHVKEIPSRMGTILGIAALIAYVGCVPCYIMAGKYYSENLKSEENVDVSNIPE